MSNAYEGYMGVDSTADFPIKKATVIITSQCVDNLAKSISILRQTVERHTYDEVIDRALTIVGMDMEDLKKEIGK